MNRVLLNPYKTFDLPRTIQHFLRDEVATCMAFNRHGNLLAVAMLSGRVLLWDFDTRAIATTFPKQPPRPSDNPILPKPFSFNGYPYIVSLCFPAPGNASAILVAYRFGILQAYHTLSSQLLCQIEFDRPIHQAIAHPKLESVAIVTLEEGLPIILRLRMGRYQCHSTSFANIMTAEKFFDLPSVQPPLETVQTPPQYRTSYANTRIATLPEASSCLKASLLCAINDFDDNGRPEELASAPSSTKRTPNFTIAFTRKDQLVLRGGPTGKLRTFRLPRDRGNSVQCAQCVATGLNQGKASIREIIVSRRDMVLVNSQDRCMRLYDLREISSDDVAVHDSNGRFVPICPTLNALATFSEIVNRSQCRTACFSIDGDYILGGVEGTQHRMHVWRVQDGHIEMSLEGPKEGVAQVLMHPLRPIIVSLGTLTGGVYVWAHEVHENWSAFSTQFTELEANEEYVEREDEFDLIENGISAQRSCVGDETVDVDITGDYRQGWFPSDSEDDAFFYVPAEPEPDKLSGSLPYFTTGLIEGLTKKAANDDAFQSIAVEDDNTMTGKGSNEDIESGRKRRKVRSTGKSKSKRPRVARLSQPTIVKSESDDVVVMGTNSVGGSGTSHSVKSPEPEENAESVGEGAAMLRISDSVSSGPPPDGLAEISHENGCVVEELVLEAGKGDTVSTE